MESPIIIIGAPRSGTSVLGRILSQHPDLAYSNEPRLIWRYGNDAKSDMLLVSDARPAVKAYVQEKFRLFVESNSKKRLLEKTPSNALRVDFVREIFPESKMIHIIRNGYDSALSIRDYWNGFTSGLSYSKIDGEQSILRQRLREIHPSQIPYYTREFLARAVGRRLGIGQVLWGPRFPGMADYVCELGVLSVAAMQWRLCVETACSQGRTMGDGYYREIRLEELTADCVGSLFDFCNLDVNSETKAYYESHFEGRKSGARKANASKNELVEISNLIAPTMDWLGYGNGHVNEL